MPSITSMARRQPAASGQSLTEVALGIVLITILLAGGVEFGRSYMAHMSIQSAAERAAAYGATAPNDWTGIQNHATGEDLFDLVDWNAVTITAFVEGDPCGGGGMHVDVEYNLPVITPFLGALIGREGFPLRASALRGYPVSSCP